VYRRLFTAFSSLSSADKTLRRFFIYDTKLARTGGSSGEASLLDRRRINPPVFFSHLLHKIELTLASFRG
jgi:hypothetical protein